ncbi:ABC transporter permease [Paenibacillus ginsengarvi]|uniref:ABC transporter permease n=1 Tax=Paenibacillus ginsengarvi TaxID=400777 RepID=A0A3B0BXH3_9BACL|nr:ABC transporter permease [Paenibacillus ginsengarvi]RKN77108.1 ABC transporter permease [Paenibacillus ginsengarvi]
MKWKQLLHSKPLLIGAALIAALLALMVTSLFYTPYGPNEMNTSLRLAPPQLAHWWGTDNFGRDIFSRIMEGTQTAFLIGLLSVAIGLVFGLLIGAVAGYAGGWLDEALMRIMDAKLAFPGILLAIMLVTVFGPGLGNTIVALGVMSIPSFARIARSGFIQYKEFAFVKAATARGAGPLRIIFHHILPNMTSPLIVAASLRFSGSVLAEAGLSYLGLGVQPPDPSWGRMLSEAQPFIVNAPWYVLLTGAVITAMVLGFNLLGDGLRDVYDKKG